LNGARVSHQRSISRNVLTRLNVGAVSTYFSVGGCGGQLRGECCARSIEAEHLFIVSNNGWIRPSLFLLLSFFLEIGENRSIKSGLWRRLVVVLPHLHPTTNPIPIFISISSPLLLLLMPDFYIKIHEYDNYMLYDNLY
jgi:hypothetical protein